MGEPKRDAKGRWMPGHCGNPATMWGPDCPPPKSPGRPPKDAWVRELEERLKDPRVRQALADRLLKTALKGTERASLQAIDLIQDRVGGPVMRGIAAQLDLGLTGVLVVPGTDDPAVWVEEAAASNAELREPGREREE